MDVARIDGSGQERAANSGAVTDRNADLSGRTTVAASVFGLAVGPSCMTILAFGAFVAPLEREFHWGLPAITFGASIISIMVMILSPIQGALVDRFGGRRVILWSIPFFAASLCAMYGLPNNLTVFYLAWIVIPTCGIGIWPVSYLRTTAGWYDKNLGLALGISNAGIGVGTMLVPLLCAYLIGSYGWRETYLALGLIALCAWPVTFWLLKDPKPAASGILMNGETLTQAARTRTFWISLVAFFCLGAYGTSLIVHQVRILIDAGIAPTVATSIPAAFGLALIAARLGTGWLLDRYPASRIMSVLMVGGAAAALLYARGPSIPEAIVCAILLGAITGAEFDVLSYIVPRYYGRRAFGRIYGSTYAVFMLASAIGTYAMGASRHSSGSYAAAMSAAVVLCLAAALLFMMLGPYRYRNGERI